MKKESVEERMAAPAGTGVTPNHGRMLMRRIAHLLYMAFNGACVVIKSISG